MEKGAYKKFNLRKSAVFICVYLREPKKNMKPILFSPPDFLPNETQILCQLFEKGLQRFHLRKETQDMKQLQLYIEDIPQVFHNQIIIHNHFSIFRNYKSLLGFHFNRNYPFSKEIIKQYPDKIFTQACHSFAEIECLDKKINYCFLSPIYKSISKEHYFSAFSEKMLQDFFANRLNKTKVIALGGITPENQAKTLTLGFENVAVLGYIWDEYRKNASVSELMQRWEAYL